jgi:hypothetical protein
MHHRYESQPFQTVRQIHNFSPIAQGATGLRERNDFNNVSQNFFKNDKFTDKIIVS